MCTWRRSSGFAGSGETTDYTVPETSTVPQHTAELKIPPCPCRCANGTVRHCPQNNTSSTAAVDASRACYKRGYPVVKTLA